MTYDLCIADHFGKHSALWVLKVLVAFFGTAFGSLFLYSAVCSAFGSLAWFQVELCNLYDCVHNCAHLSANPMSRKGK